MPSHFLSTLNQSQVRTIIILEIHGIAGLIEVNIFIATLKRYIFLDNCRC